MSGVLGEGWSSLCRTGLLTHTNAAAKQRTSTNSMTAPFRLRPAFTAASPSRLSLAVSDGRPRVASSSVEATHRSSFRCSSYSKTSPTRYNTSKPSAVITSSLVIRRVGRASGRIDGIAYAVGTAAALGHDGEVRLVRPSRSGSNGGICIWGGRVAGCTGKAAKVPICTQTNEPTGVVTSRVWPPLPNLLITEPTKDADKHHGATDTENQGARSGLRRRITMGASPSDESTPEKHRRKCRTY